MLLYATNEQMTYNAASANTFIDISPQDILKNIATHIPLNASKNHCQNHPALRDTITAAHKAHTARIACKLLTTAYSTKPSQTTCAITISSTPTLQAKTLARNNLLVRPISMSTASKLNSSSIHSVRQTPGSRKQRRQIHIFCNIYLNISLHPSKTAAYAST